MMNFVKCEWTVYLNPHLSVQTSLRVGGTKERDEEDISWIQSQTDTYWGGSILSEHKCC